MKLDATNQSQQLQEIVNSSEFHEESSWARMKRLAKEKPSNVNYVWNPESEPELEPDYDFDPYHNPPLEERFRDWWKYDYTNRITGIID